MYPARTGEEHRRLARQYRDAEPGVYPGQREYLFKENGTRYYALSRLKYFDAVRMSVLDPMHNILLGELVLFEFIHHLSNASLRDL